ncbi:MAG TPA: TIGR04053 family radical SAM/SPASM domain-containing protein [Candidatus Dormibacteraeota bacterium]|jgi:radical SAM protein
MSQAVAVQPRGHGLNFGERPMLVFWEVTRSCLLSCRHCRASAIATALPGELSASEGRELARQVAAFGRPYPILVMTGGDCLMRPDIHELAAYAVGLGIPVALSPSVTPLLTPEAAVRIKATGVRAVSISLDGAQARTHDTVRGVPGHFAKTVDALLMLKGSGLKVQVNTTVMRDNVEELADVAALMESIGVDMWEVFFLVSVGRGEDVEPITPREHEEVCHFLFDASRYGFVVRTVEAPFFRRVVRWRRGLDDDVEVANAFGLGSLYGRLEARLRVLLGPGVARPAAQSASTRDGKGIVFVAHDGDVHPAGFLPVTLGNVRERPLADIYRDSDLLNRIRGAQFSGRCGICEFKDLCGGSRSRAFATFGDALAEDPACNYVPALGLLPTTVRRRAACPRP